MIYFIQEGEDGPVKIGYSKENCERRLSSLQTGNPRQLTLAAVRTGAHGMPAKERELHDRFAAHRIRGEWFEPCDEIMEIIERVPKNILRPRLKGPSEIEAAFERGKHFGYWEGVGKGNREIEVRVLEALGLKPREILEGLL